MVIATQVVFSLIIALILSIIFGLILHRKAPRRGFFLFFLMIFLFTLAGGIWIRPFGPSSQGVFWVPMIIVGLIGSIFLYYRAPRRPPRNRRETINMLERIEEQKKMEKITFLTIDLLFWVVLVLLVTALIVYFVRH